MSFEDLEYGLNGVPADHGRVPRRVPDAPGDNEGEDDDAPPKKR